VCVPFDGFVPTATAGALGAALASVELGPGASVAGRLCALPGRPGSDLGLGALGGASFAGSAEIVALAA
jgi:hypothetical protein